MDRLEKARIITNIDFSHVVEDRVYFKQMLSVLVDIAESLHVLANRGVEVGERPKSQ